jgi:hypothetical protein
MLRPHFTPGKDTVPILQEAEWAPGPVWIGAENLAPTAIRSPDRAARSQSLFQLSYRAHATYQSVSQSIGNEISKFLRSSERPAFHTNINLLAQEFYI